MLLFPGFCVLIGTAFVDLQLRLRNDRAAAVVLNPQQPGVRQLVRQDLEKLIGKAPATIGVLHFGPYFYTVMPVIKPLNNEKITVYATTILFVCQPNQDDVVYFHRALSQLFALDQPIFLRQTSVDMDAAAFSPVHLATSHEMLMALLGDHLGIDPLYFYQIIGHALSAFAIPFVFYWYVRRFGLDRRPAARGALFGVGFLLLDNPGPAVIGTVSRYWSFGMTAGYLWQGRSLTGIGSDATATAPH
jgi:hypothetical protein